MRFSLKSAQLGALAGSTSSAMMASDGTLQIVWAVISVVWLLVLVIT